MVTIAILNYQRKETLRLALQHALAQDYPRLEVLVVDNCSTDGSDRMVEDEFPLVRLVRLPENIGCAARNAGVAAAKGEIVVTIDNDVLLTSPRAVRTVVALFRQHPNVACVNFKILDAQGKLSKRDWCHPRDWRTFADSDFLTDYVLEGASAHRRESFERTGGYWPLLFIGHEGLDLALRLLDAGHDLLYTPAVSVMHLVSSDARPSSRIYYTFTRNSVWVALRNHRPVTLAGALMKDVALMAFSSIRAGQVGGFAAGLRDAVIGIPRVLPFRRTISRTTSRRLRRIRRSEPNLLRKVIRHWRERPI